MPIQDRVGAELREAMRARDAARTNALRNIRAALTHESKKEGTEALSDERCTEVLRRLEKQRRESIEAFEKGGRAEQAGAERAELAVIREFLPALADEETTRAWVAAAIEATGAASAGDLGRVMGALMREHRGKVDGALANRIARELLGG